jgi:hypothetical protein
MRTLEQLRHGISREIDRELPFHLHPRLWYRDDDRGLFVAFHGSPDEYGLYELFELLSQSELASRLVHLSVAGPDAGSNGTCNLDLKPLVSAGTPFPRLSELRIERNAPAQHNRRVVAEDYDEDGVLTELLRLSSALEVLESPSAPRADFFEVGPRNLRCLRVDAGYDHQSFVRNFAERGTVFRTRTLEFGEYAERNVEGFAEHCTPLEDYLCLFESEAFQRLDTFSWRNPALSDAQIAELRVLRPTVSVQLVRSSAVWLPKGPA